MNKGSYRPDIDGLRALAIAPVVWFHSGLPGVPGGFTGVDTFFVISGYLITSIIHREIDDGSFSYARFYERRVRRIAPALLVVLLSTMAVASLLLLPYEFEKLGESAIAAVAMVSNIYFWREGGYFALSENVTPLLHTWSLGVEEQFYLLFPVCLMLAERYRLTRLTIMALAMLGFALCLAGTLRSPSATFYLLPTRGWELMIGAMLAVGVVRIPASIKHSASAIGLGLIVGAALMLSKADPFPGWRAALPAVGAALIIGAGPSSVSANILSRPALVDLGKISYSLYLWHWPVFAFLRHYRAEPDLPATWALAGVAASLILSLATYRWVEQPARLGSTPYRVVVKSSVACSVAIFGAALIAIKTNGLPSRLPDHVVATAALRSNFAPLARSCVNTPLRDISAACHLGPSGRPKFMVWGDSHAAALSEGIGRGLGQPGLLAAMNACAPSSGWVNPALRGVDGDTCQRRNRQVLALIEAAPSIDTVFLVAYWPSHAEAGRSEFWNSVQQVIDMLRAEGRRIVVLAGIPDPRIDVPWANAIRARFGRPRLELECRPAQVPLINAIVIDLSQGFCNDQPAATLFVDANHISRDAGIKIVAKAVETHIRR